MVKRFGYKVRIKAILLLVSFWSMAVYVYAKEIKMEDEVLIGKWSYFAADAPSGFQDGVFYIKEDDGRLIGELEIHGSLIPIGEFIKKDDLYICYVMVEGISAELVLKRKDAGWLGVVMQEGADAESIVTLRRTD